MSFQLLCAARMVQTEGKPHPELENILSGSAGSQQFLSSEHPTVLPW